MRLAHVSDAPVDIQVSFTPDLSVEQQPHSFPGAISK